MRAVGAADRDAISQNKRPLTGPFILCSLPSLPIIPVVNILTHAILFEAVAFLNFAFELLALAVDDVEIIIGEVAPLLLHAGP